MKHVSLESWLRDVFWWRAIVLSADTPSGLRYFALPLRGRNTRGDAYGVWVEAIVLSADTPSGLRYFALPLRGRNTRGNAYGVRKQEIEARTETGTYDFSFFI